MLDSEHTVLKSNRLPVVNVFPEDICIFSLDICKFSQAWCYQCLSLSFHNDLKMALLWKLALIIRWFPVSEHPNPFDSQGDSFGQMAQLWTQLGVPAGNDPKHTSKLLLGRRQFPSVMQEHQNKSAACSYSTRGCCLPKHRSSEPHGAVLVKSQHSIIHARFWCRQSSDSNRYKLDSLPGCSRWAQVRWGTWKSSTEGAERCDVRRRCHWCSVFLASELRTWAACSSWKFLTSAMAP